LWSLLVWIWHYIYLYSIYSFQDFASSSKNTNFLKENICISKTPFKSCLLHLLFDSHFRASVTKASTSHTFALHYEWHMLPTDFTITIRCNIIAVHPDYWSYCCVAQHQWYSTLDAVFQPCQTWSSGEHVLNLQTAHSRSLTYLLCGTACRMTLFMLIVWFLLRNTTHLTEPLSHNSLPSTSKSMEPWCYTNFLHIECVHNHTSDESDESDLLNFVQNQLRAKRFAFRIKSRSARTRLRKIWLHGEIFY